MKLVKDGSRRRCDRGESFYLLFLTSVFFEAKFTQYYGEYYCGNSTIFIRNYPTKYLSPLYSNNHYVDYQYFFEFYNSYVLDLARFEDHTFAFFKGKC